MQILPAIDLRGGKCVRLTQGKADQQTTYTDDAVEMARRFCGAGATMLHLVDLDGAFQGHAENLAIIEAIRKAVSIPLELGGGMRSVGAIQSALSLGIDSVIVGTMAVQHPEQFQMVLAEVGADVIQLGVDVANNQVATHGWQQQSDWSALAFVQHWQAQGIKRAIFTDISRDGMLAGPNLEALTALAEPISISITASGGVTTQADLTALAALTAHGVDRVIIGKAFYEGTLPLEVIGTF